MSYILYCNDNGGSLFYGTLKNNIMVQCEIHFIIMI